MGRHGVKGSVPCMDNITQHATLWLRSLTASTWLPQPLAFVHLFLSLYRCRQQINLCTGFGKENGVREEEMSGRRDRGLVWVIRERQGFLNVFLFEGTLVISGTPRSFSLSDQFFLQSRLHFSQNTSPGLKRRRCHGSAKKRRQIAVYRVALCGMCARRSRTAEVFLCRWMHSENGENEALFWLWQSVAFLQGCSAEAAAALSFLSPMKGFISCFWVWLTALLLTFFIPKGDKNVTFGEAAHVTESLYLIPFMRHTRRDVLAEKWASVAFILMNLALLRRRSFNLNYFQ